MQSHRLLLQASLLSMCRGYVKNSLDGKGHVRRVVEHVLVGDLGVCEGLVEALVLVNRDFAFLSGPNRSEGAHSLAIDLDGIADELRELLYNFFDDHFLAELA